MQFFSGTPPPFSNRRELRLHLNVVPTSAGAFKSRHILLHKSIECRHFDFPVTKDGGTENLCWVIYTKIQCPVVSYNYCSNNFWHKEFKMPKKEFYSVARGLTIGIFTGWRKCNASVHKYHNAVFKKFDNSCNWPQDTVFWCKLLSRNFPPRHLLLPESQNGDIQWIWSGGWEWWAVSGVIGRWSWFYLHIYATKDVYFWILQRRLARHWGAGVIHTGSRRWCLKKNSRIELWDSEAGNIRKQLWLRIPKGITQPHMVYFFMS